MSAPSLLIKPYHNHVPHNVYPLSPEIADWYAGLRLPDGGGRPYMYRSMDAPLFGDSAAALKAAQTISAHGGSYRFLPENIVGPAALRNRNIVLIGGPNYSAYAERILRGTPLTILEDEKTGEEVIYDRARRSGFSTPFMPKRDESGKLLVIYGLITTFSNQSGVGKVSRAILVSGITGAGLALDLVCCNRLPWPPRDRQCSNRAERSVARCAALDLRERGESLIRKGSARVDLRLS